MSEAIARWIQRMKSEVLPAKEISRPTPKFTEFRHLGDKAVRAYHRNYIRWERLAGKEEELRFHGLWGSESEESVWRWYDEQLEKEKAAS